jgi:hypothetical protein
MLDRINESDWKLFRQLQAIALQRFCQRVLDEVVQVASNADKTSHERYGEMYGLIKDRDKELAHAFDDPRRSRALVSRPT